MPPAANAQRVVAYAKQDCGNLIRGALAAGFWSARSEYRNNT